MNKLKSISVVSKTNAAGVVIPGYQAVGITITVGETRFNDSDRTGTIIYYDGPSYADALLKARTMSHACNCGLFDIVELNGSVPLSVPLVESYAAMNSEGKL